MDTGLKRKNFFFCCVAIFFVGGFVFGFPGVMASYWQETFGVGKSDVGKLMFCILIGTGLSMYLTGKLQEKFKYNHLIFTGNFICGLAMFCVGFAKSMFMVYAWGVVTGFFCGFVYIPVLTVVQGLYPEKKGTSTGVVNLLFGGASAVISPFITMLLLAYGAITTTIITAVLCVVITSLASFFINLPDLSLNKNKDAATETGVKVLSFRETLSLRSFRLLWGVWALAGAGGISMITLSALYGVHLGFALDQYVWILIGFSITNGAGRLVCGRLSDYFSQQKILMVVFILAGTSYLVLIFSQDLTLVSILASFVGCAFGSMFAVSAPLVSNCFGLVNFGRIFGLVFTAYGFVAGFLGPWLSGYILDLKPGSFPVVFIYLAVFYFIASFFIIRVKPVDFSLFK